MVEWRWVMGVNIGFSKEEVLDIRNRAFQGETYESLGREYGCSGTNISQIARHKTYKEFPGPKTSSREAESPSGICAVEGCTSPVSSLDWCRRHYMRQWRYGDPEAVNMYPAPDDAEPYELPGEIWKPIPGWGDLYEASNLGRIRSKDRIIETVEGHKRGYEGRVLAQYLDNRGSGYFRTRLTRENESTNYLVHRLVLSTFEERHIDSNTPVRHLNGDSRDNRIENLKTGTHRDNFSDKVENGKLGTLLEQAMFQAGVWRKMAVWAITAKAATDLKDRSLLVSEEELASLPPLNPSIPIKERMNIPEMFQPNATTETPASVDTAAPGNKN